MTATFGKLQGRSLELGDGLNIIEAPNETGKSTWCAFLLSILYGVNSRERDRAGFIADKNRFAPWSGAAMSGRMDCGTELGELALTRATRRQTSPMGEFSAVYAGTNEPVPGLTGAACGETLLGISREVFERSAFIRQNNLPISQDAELERRIAALISSGEEGTSYTEAADALKQLNRRRHNRTGQLPALETELAELDRQLSESNSLARQLVQARSEVEALSRRAENPTGGTDGLQPLGGRPAPPGPLRCRIGGGTGRGPRRAGAGAASAGPNPGERDHRPAPRRHRQSGDHPESRGQGPVGAGRGHEGIAAGGGRCE
ncbi:AAA family ATPase [Dysosmobacter welbionis]|uniref:AAA family ATPase n=1 Tax=Dysosmobacter welbionis TaxID=2093857 RepID=UPI00300E755C